MGNGDAEGDPVGQEFQQMHLHQDNVPNGNEMRSEVSRVLQRRSDVLSQAAEDADSSRIMEPSWEMISSSQAQDNTENSAGPSRRGQKRKDHSMNISLVPMLEDEQWSATNGVNGPPADECNGADGMDEPPPSRSVRGTRAKKASAGSSDAGPPTKVRRSLRQTPQKNTRR
jgi:hypothetical protein